MAALNEIARNYADEIRDGIAWVLVWKTGRSWNATAVWLDAETDTFEPDDLDTAREILKQDPNAVMLNGYYCGHFGETWRVLATANRYAANKTLAVSLTTEEGEPFAVITVNITASDFKADDHTAFLDVNNCPWAEEFLRKTGLGKPTGILGHSGYCTYPLYTFDTTRMKPGGSGSTKRPKTLKKAIGKEN